MLPKRAAIALSLTAFALVLLVSFRTPTDVGVDQPGDTAVVSSNGRGGGSRDGTPATPAPTAAANGNGSGGSGGSGASGGSGSAGGGTKTIDGPVVQTRYGPVQVEITVSGSQVTDVVALQLPDGDRHSSQISSRVDDLLASQALEAQGGSIDGVSGATYTSEAYAESLQAALDAAGL